MREKTVFVRLVALCGAATLAMISLVLLAGPAQADSDYRLPGLSLDWAGSNCTFENPSKAQIDYFIFNTTIDPFDVVLDYRLTAVGRPDIEPLTGLVAEEVRESFLFEGGTLTAMLETQGQIVGTSTVSIECPEGGLGLPGPVSMTKECLESQLYYTLQISSTSVRPRLVDESMTVTIGTESFAFGASDLSEELGTIPIARQQTPIPGERFSLAIGDEVLLDVDDVFFECEQQPLDIDIELSVECPAVDDGAGAALAYQVSNRRKNYTDFEIRVEPSVAVTEIRNVAPGETRLVQLASGLADGDFVVATRLFGAPLPIDERSITVDCADDVAGQASIESSCFGGNGVIAARVTGATPGGSTMVLSVSGLADKVLDLAAGESAVIRRTGRPDDIYGVIVTDRGIEVAREVVRIDCDPPQPIEVDLSVTCVSPRIIAVVTNASDAPVDYSIDIVGVEVPPLTGTVGVGESATEVRTGRQDGIYTVQASADGALVSTQTVEVDCVAAFSSSSINITHYCFAGNGVIAAILAADDTAGGVTFTFQVSGLSDRDVQVEAGQIKTSLRTGRPDGVYDVIVTGDGIEATRQITIACD